jgi:Fe-S cluster assembly protein SufD
MVGATATELVKARYLADFEAFERAEGGRTPRWLRALRRAAITRFGEAGFPTPREEAWRYTSVAPLLEPGFPPGRDEAPGGLEADLVDPGLLGAAEWTRLVYVNGRFAPALSSLGPLPGGVRVGSLADALVTEAALIERHLGRHADPARDAFAALNTAFARDGALVSVAAGARLAEPICLVFVGADGVLAQPRTLVVAGPGSEATVIEHHIGAPDCAYLTNAVTEIVVGEGAAIHHATLLEESERAFHVRTVQVDQDRDSRFGFSVAVMGGRLVRNTLGVLLHGEGARAALDGFYAVAGVQHVDNHVTVEHAAPRCTSQQLYKGILDGRSRAVFNGRILVRRDAQKTDATQTNKSLLLAEGPEVYSKPQLEIFADDVRCTHGAAEGQVAEDAMFYLESRGLGEATARALLAYGFAREVVDRIPVEPIRARLERLLHARLRLRSLPAQLPDRLVETAR